MSLILTKGGSISLTARVPGLARIVVALGWDPDTDFDLDASAILLGTNGRVPSDRFFVFYNNLTSPDGYVRHTGDNRTGAGAGDDEQVHVELAELPRGIARIVFPVSIYAADQRRQSFGQVRNAYIRVLDPADDREIVRYDLSTATSTETAMVFGEIYRSGMDWRFRAVGQGYASGLVGIARDFGVRV